MNRPIRLPKQTRTRSSESDANPAGYRRRRGLCTAEQIVTLILKRYGIDEDLGIDPGRGNDPGRDTVEDPCNAPDNLVEADLVEADIVEADIVEAGIVEADIVEAGIVEAGISSEITPPALAPAGAIPNSACFSHQQTFCWD